MKEYEILNEKLNQMFEEIMCLRHDLQKIEYEKTKKELEYKLENAQEKLERHKEDIRWQFEYLDERKKCFRSIDNRFPVRELREEIESLEI